MRIITLQLLLAGLLTQLPGLAQSAEPLEKDVTQEYFDKFPAGDITKNKYTFDKTTGVLTCAEGWGAWCSVWLMDDNLKNTDWLTFTVEFEVEEGKQLQAGFKYTDGNLEQVKSDKSFTVPLSNVNQVEQFFLQPADAAEYTIKRLYFSRTVDVTKDYIKELNQVDVEKGTFESTGAWVWNQRWFAGDHDNSLYESFTIEFEGPAGEADQGIKAGFQYESGGDDNNNGNSPLTITITDMSKVKCFYIMGHAAGTYTIKKIYATKAKKVDSELTWELTDAQLKVRDLDDLPPATVSDEKGVMANADIKYQIVPAEGDPTDIKPDYRFTALDAASEVTIQASFPGDARHLAAEEPIKKTFSVDPITAAPAGDLKKVDDGDKVDITNLALSQWPYTFRRNDAKGVPQRTALYEPTTKTLDCLIPYQPYGMNTSLAGLKNSGYKQLVVEYTGGDLMAGFVYDQGKPDQAHATASPLVVPIENISGGIKHLFIQPEAKGEYQIQKVYYVKHDKRATISWDFEALTFAPGDDMPLAKVMVDGKELTTTVTKDGKAEEVSVRPYYSINGQVIDDAPTLYLRLFDGEEYSNPVTITAHFDGNGEVARADEVSKSFQVVRDGSNKSTTSALGQVRDLSQATLVYYNLAGQRVDAPTAGLYVVLATLPDGATKAFTTLVK